MFRGAFRRERCLVPASGYYEWQASAGRKQPYYIHPADPPLFGFAGLYTLHPGAQGEMGTVAVLTTPAGASTRHVHECMPAILRREDYARWLDPAADPATLLGLLERYPAEGTVLHPVSTRVNAVRNDDESCIAPVE